MSRITKKMNRSRKAALYTAGLRSLVSSTPFVTAAALCWPGYAKAATVTSWTGSVGDSLWTDTGDWSNGVPGTGYAATFSGAGNGDTSIGLGGNTENIQALIFTGAPAAYTLGTNAGDTLNFDSTGSISVGTVTTGNTVTTSQTIDASIVDNGVITINNAAASTLLALDGNISGSGSITFYSGGTFNGGSILFGASSSYSGGTTINSSATTTILIGSNSAFGSGYITMANTSNSPLEAYGSNITLSNPVQLSYGFTVANATAPYNLTFAGPFTFLAARTLSIDSYGQVTTLGSSPNSSTITLPGSGTININSLRGSGVSATLVLNDTIQGPAFGSSNVAYGPNGSGSLTPGNLIINGANTYTGTTLFNNQTTGTLAQEVVELGVSSVGNPGAISSGPFGTGTVTLNDTEPPIFEPYGADITVGNAIVFSSGGFFAGSAPTTGTVVTVDPAGTTHNLFFTGPITDDGKVISNNLAAGVGLYLGSATTASTLSLTSATSTFQSQTGTGTTYIYDQITGAGSLLAKEGGTYQFLNSDNNYTGATTLNGGTLDVIGAIPNSGTIVVNAAAGTPATFIVESANALSPTAPITVTGPTSVFDANNAQTLASISSTGYTGFTAGTSIVGQGNGVGTGAGGSLTTGGVSGAGTLTVNSTANLYASNITQSLLTIGGGSTVTIADSAAPGNTAATTVLTDINNLGTLDLNNNDLIITDTTQYSTVKALINNAADGGKWDQAGITSSSARANSSQYGLGYAQASTIGSTSFDGQTFTDAVLAKYTLLGDTQLRGQVGIGDYDTVLNNFGTGTDWYQGNFHYSGTVGIGDYDDVLNNFGSTASGNFAAGPALARGLSPAISINPNFAKADLKLEVNTVTGDVYVLANTSIGFAGYTVADPSAHLLGGSTSPDPAKLLSVSSANGGNTNVYETAGTYVNWNKITEVANQIAEGQNNNGYANHSSRDDTVNIPAGGTIDFGDIYNSSAGVQDITFNFAEAGSDPTNGSAYYGAEVDYVTTPEPGSVSLLAAGAPGMLARRRRSRPRNGTKDAMV